MWCVSALFRFSLSTFSFPPLLSTLFCPYRGLLRHAQDRYRQAHFLLARYSRPGSFPRDFVFAERFQRTYYSVSSRYSLRAPTNRRAPNRSLNHSLTHYLNHSPRGARKRAPRAQTLSHTHSRSLGVIGTHACAYMHARPKIQRCPAIQTRMRARSLYTHAHALKHRLPLEFVLTFPFCENSLRCRVVYSIISFRRHVSAEENVKYTPKGKKKNWKIFIGSSSRREPFYEDIQVRDFDNLIGTLSAHVFVFLSVQFGNKRYHFFYVCHFFVVRYNARTRSGARNGIGRISDSIASPSVETALKSVTHGLLRFRFCEIPRSHGKIAYCSHFVVVSFSVSLPIGSTKKNLILTVKIYASPFRKKNVFVVISISFGHMCYS